jgi:hypothetical protein
MEERTPADCTISVVSCVNIPATRLSVDAVGLPSMPYTAPGDRMPLKIKPAMILFARMGQSTPYPGGMNTLTVTFVTSFVLDRVSWSSIRIQNLTGASAPTGPLSLFNITASADHLLFGHDSDAALAPPGTGMWDDTNKELTMYVQKRLHPARQYVVSFVVENPSLAQEAANVRIRAEAGVSAEGIFEHDLQRDLSAEGIQGAKKGDAAPLRVWQSVWNSGTRIKQRTSDPAALNTLAVAFGFNVGLRGTTRAFNALRIVITNLFGGEAETGPIAIGPWAEGSSDKVDYSLLFSATAGGLPGQGYWDNFAKVRRCARRLAHQCRV